jgi:pentose-5-phosphate-3-epimerase
MTYAVVEVLLHAAEHFLRCLDLSPFLTVSPSVRVQRWCVEFLSNIQEVRSQFLQLTARDAHQ